MKWRAYSPTTCKEKQSMLCSSRMALSEDPTAIVEWIQSTSPTGWGLSMMTSSQRPMASTTTQITMGPIRHRSTSQLACRCPPITSKTAMRTLWGVIMDQQWLNLSTVSSHMVILLSHLWWVTRNEMWLLESWETILLAWTLVHQFNRDSQPQGAPREKSSDRSSPADSMNHPCLTMIRILNDWSRNLMSQLTWQRLQRSHSISPRSQSGMWLNHSTTWTKRSLQMTTNSNPTMCHSTTTTCTRKNMLCLLR